MCAHCSCTMRDKTVNKQSRTADPADPPCKIAIECAAASSVERASGEGSMRMAYRHSPSGLIHTVRSARRISDFCSICPQLGQVPSRRTSRKCCPSCDAAAQSLSPTPVSASPRVHPMRIDDTMCSRRSASGEVRVSIGKRDRPVEHCSCGATDTLWTLLLHPVRAFVFTCTNM